ncbi:MAG: ankyrin repeat domain-containing protein [Alphaproteobacteria bacterium]|jgi:ankyrin repeat protein|nr:ankyrin repeat domain-containing protein [Candidatus Jidaibacter sp.]
MRDIDTQLLNAARTGDYEDASTAINSGAAVSVKEVGKSNSSDEGFAYNYTPLHWAAYRVHETDSSDHLAVATLLIQNGVELNAQDHSGQTPLHWAIRAGNTDIATLLIKNGAELNAQDHLGQTPLYWAIRAGNAYIVKLLIEEGADVNAKDNIGQTPLFWAIKLRIHDLYKLYAELGKMRYINVLLMILI